MLARIRTVQPGLFKHALLFDVEQAMNAGGGPYYPVRLAYVGLWTMCDREGRFVWKPRELRADVLPYDEGVDFARILDALALHGFILQYTVGGRVYGWVPRFTAHQHINVNERASQLPAPPLDVVRKWEGLVLAQSFGSDVDESARVLADAQEIEAGDAAIEPLAATSSPAWMFFARSGDRVRIGWSRNPWARVKDMRAALPDVELLAMQRATSEDVARVRREYRAQLIEGQWFRWVDTMQAYTHTSAGEPVLHDAELRPTATSLTTADDGRATGALLSTTTSLATDLSRSCAKDPNGNTLGTRGGRVGDASGEREGIDHEKAYGKERTTETAAVVRDVVGTDSNALALSSAPTSPANATTQPTTALVVQGTRSRPLPKIEGRATGAAIIARLGRVLEEVHTGARERLTADQTRRMQAGVVFGYWMSKFDHPRALLDDRRERVIVKRLEENGGDVSELLYALDGARNDEWVMGTARNSTHANTGIDYILRERANVERYANTRKDYRTGKPHPLALKYAAVIRDGPAEQEGATNVDATEGPEHHAGEQLDGFAGGTGSTEHAAERGAVEPISTDVERGANVGADR